MEGPHRRRPCPRQVWTRLSSVASLARGSRAPASAPANRVQKNTASRGLRLVRAQGSLAADVTYRQVHEESPLSFHLLLPTYRTHIRSAVC